MTKQKYLDLDLTSKISNHCLIGNLSAICNRILLGPKLLACAACLWSKMPMFQRAGMREGGLPLLLAFQYLIPMIWRACDLKWKTGIPTLRTCHFEASEEIMTKHKSQALHITRIKYWKASGSGNSPSINHALWNIGILLHKQSFWSQVYVGSLQKNLSKIPTITTFLLPNKNALWTILWRPKRALESFGLFYTYLHQNF